MQIQKLNSAKWKVIPETPEDKVVFNQLLRTKDIIEPCIPNKLLLRISLDLYKNRGDVAELGEPRLRGYQLADIQKMLDLGSSLNCNKMGYGKTVEAIMFCKALNLKTILVIAPKSVLLQWQREFEKWWPTCTAKIVIINYERLLNKQFEETLHRFVWDVIICDEAHRIKNDHCKRTRKVKGLPAQYRLALTGTPILNKPDDLWSILHWVNPMFSGKSYWRFVEAFCEIVTNDFGSAPQGATRDPALLQLLRLTVQATCIVNPEMNLTIGKNVCYVPVQMYPKVQKEYTNLKKLLLDELTIDVPITNGLTKLLRLQQLTSCPSILMEGEDIRNGKFDWLVDLLEDNPDTKIVVFSRFRKTLEYLQIHLRKHHIKAVAFNGTMDPQERQESLNSFILRDARVILGTIGAMGQGVDGLQEVCSTVVFIDRDWSPALNEQAEDRVNRFGQAHLVNVYVLECESSVDQYIGKKLFRKIEDIRSILEVKNVKS